MTLASPLGPAGTPPRPASRFLDPATPPHIATLILLAGISALNMSIFLPSLQGMADHFGADYAVMQFAVSGYLAATALLQLVIGPLSDQFGRRPVVLGALAIFVLATIGCLLAPNTGTFLAFRFLQSAVVAGMVLSRAVVRDIVPAAESASMIGYVTMGMSLVPMVGPMIGGALDQLAGWRASFTFLALAGAGVLLLAWRDQGETATGMGRGLVAQIRAYPRLLTSQRFWGYSLCAAMGSGAFFALLGGASFVAQGVFGLSPLATGIALGAPAVGYMAGNGISGRYAVRAGIDRLALIGAAVSSFGMGLSLVLSLAGVDSAWVFFGLCTFLGLGNGLLMPNAIAGSLSVVPELAGSASGLGGTIMIGGGAVLSALAGTWLTEETGILPLQVIMLVTSLLAGVAILWVMARARAVAARG
ncbi:multidrug effflux MFS transporter [Wenxinia saemankumensis]|uniref:Bcr/CflA family efflux transporter n=1 Tax=Wenxinia saemankumensis TaxID=1447782 RepID=A0A1M6AQP4_9RHOB|nr:multidrug effflux MFS transporter [Wenxinia saemankumensis]SHI38820.1 MFS transporter, DHA1 family, bicyclomycin/chloramphenicol resistance protein [Wenxinia saemankumensis]